MKKKLMIGTMKSKTKQLPDWFNGEHYSSGDIVKNPFSGESYELNANELAMYDFIIGCGVMFEKGFKDKDVIRDFEKGLSWFRSSNAKAYMILLD